MLIVSRVLAGMGVSGVQNGCFTTIAGCVPMEKRPMSQLALATGPLIRAALTKYTTWRWCFWINLLIGGVAAGLILLTLFLDNMSNKPPYAMTAPRSLQTKLDLLGVVLFAGCTIQLLFALQYGNNQFAWNSSTAISLLCSAGMTFRLACVGLAQR
ncbi:conserved hypothetical protein [Talaromyces stipitatus ATCC 10500]|uniref:Major facilitator superfamily (MFS) profile domain-containing protein n=1 Tax=Talaromyces stipitatus (strain ATCC 10500 / CBS 375.48 / QM 6759 / NRRL 1006) TaxID=441959 RepID=B8MHV5_TALSN|nr:uncharacterized protein TSTA_015230 [Talaromyces stipitatus ATCC 10500]EED16435.1 conserved hypothetical protein [Talaromyces stipitatus ATCC 10500]